jgi:hypothetical protein
MFMLQQRIKLVTKDRIYEELKHVFDKLPKYYRKILLGYFNNKVGIVHTCMKLLGIINVSFDVTYLLLMIFALKRDEVRRGWRKIHSEEVNDLYSSRSTYNWDDQVNEDEMGSECGTNDKRGTYI